MTSYQKIRVLRNKETKQLSKHLFSIFNLDVLGKKDLVEEINISGKHVLTVNKEPYFIIYETRNRTDKMYVPTLKLIYKLGDKIPFKSITVDKGAVKFIVSGANLMRPGIIQIDGDIEKNDLIFIKDEKGRILAVGLSLFSSGKIWEMKSGIVAKNLHHLGDKIWSYK